MSEIYDDEVLVLLLRRVVGQPVGSAVKQYIIPIVPTNCEASQTWKAVYLNCLKAGDKVQASGVYLPIGGCLILSCCLDQMHQKCHEYLEQ